MSLLQPDDPQSLRAALVAEIRQNAKETKPWTGRERFGDAVLDALGRVERHLFIPASHAVGLRQAYANKPQPIGFGQTISQPYIVALMTDFLDLRGNETVLEVGAGCGYQSAVLAQLAHEVFAIERLQPLADMARATLSKLGYETVRVTCRNGAHGWPEHAPYDAILVAACLNGPIPDALIGQLKPGGRMVIPLGPFLGPQMLHVGRKDDTGRFTHSPVLPVSFVPLVTEAKSG